MNERTKFWTINKSIVICYPKNTQENTATEKETEKKYEDTI